MTRNAQGSPYFWMIFSTILRKDKYDFSFVHSQQTWVTTHNRPCGTPETTTACYDDNTASRSAMDQEVLLQRRRQRTCNSDSDSSLAQEPCRGQRVDRL
jgi:hypothetical protein